MGKARGAAYWGRWPTAVGGVALEVEGAGVSAAGACDGTCEGVEVEVELDVEVGRRRVEVGVALAEGEEARAAKEARVAKEVEEGWAELSEGAIGDIRGGANSAARAAAERDGVKSEDET